MNQQLKYKVSNNAPILDGNFIEAKTLFLLKHNITPNVCFITKIARGEVFKYLKEKYGKEITGVYQYSEFNNKKGEIEFFTTIIDFRNKFIVELAYERCEILYKGRDYKEVVKLFKEIGVFKVKEKKKKFEINLLVKGDSGLELKDMELKKTRLDLKLWYEDDFAAVDATIRERLNRKADKGIVLLHGLPGTGKTTYLRYLVGKIKKKVIFISPSVAGNLMDPGLIDILIENPGSVLVIEDAENIIKDRKYDSDSSVSNLLNISDGLLADFLNVQVVCTFNSHLSFIDSALMRKGRLIAKYEFGKLSIRKAQALSDHAGFKTIIKQPMTVSEIMNQDKKSFEEVRPVIGFRTRNELQISNPLHESVGQIGH